MVTLVLCTMLSGTSGLIWSSRSEIILNSQLGPLRSDARRGRRVRNPGVAIGSEIGDIRAILWYREYR